MTDLSHRTQLFVDMDGVLADFDRGFSKHFAITPGEYQEQWGETRFWASVVSTEGFFADLPVIPGAREFMAWAEGLRPIILTGLPRSGDRPYREKSDWCRRCFPGVPLIGTASRLKHLYCRKGDLLIDDRKDNVERWVEAGGKGFLFTGPDDFSAVRLWVQEKLQRASLPEVSRCAWARTVSGNVWHCATCGATCGSGGRKPDLCLAGYMRRGE